MDSSDSLNCAHPCRMNQRELFSRLVFFFGIDPSISMEIIAFWLWIEANGHANFLQRVNFFDNSHILYIIVSGKKFVETLHQKQNDSNIRSRTSIRFRQEAIEGIAFYLNTVCYKVLADLREKADLVARNDEMKELVHQICQTYQDYMVDQPLENTKDLTFKSVEDFLTPSYKHYGESNNFGRNPSGHQHQLNHGVAIASRPDSFSPSNLANSSINMDPSFSSHTQQHCKIPQDERTLFVTFSNGYPLTKEELYDFFMRHFGDVEEIRIEEPTLARPPLYAHIIFYSLETLFRVLDGNDKVKFMTNGKHLWARQFVPKRNK